MHFNPFTARERPETAALCAIAVALLLSACGGSSGDKADATATPGDTNASTQGAPKCGLGNGQKATGTPIKIGAIATKQPGTDFTDIPNTAKAYFDCVNDNGGINGRRSQYVIETEQTDPGQIASLAKKLIETDKVLGDRRQHRASSSAPSTTSTTRRKGYYVIAAGIAPECYGRRRTYAAVNMGPRYSSDGAAQYADPQGRQEDRVRSSRTCRAPATSRPARARSPRPPGSRS